MTQRLRTIFTSASVSVLNPLILSMTDRALPTAVSRVTGVVTLLVVHNLGRVRCGRWGGPLGGRRAARGWHGDALGGSRWSRFIFIGEADEAPNGGSPLVELLRSRREVEEQLRARQSFCWRGWR